MKLEFDEAFGADIRALWVGLAYSALALGSNRQYSPNLDGEFFNTSKFEIRFA